LPDYSSFSVLLHKKADESNSAVGHQLFQLILGKYSASNDSHQRVRDQVMRDAVGSAWLFSTERFIKTSLAFLAVGGERIELSYLSVSDFESDASTNFATRPFCWFHPNNTQIDLLQAKIHNLLNLPSDRSLWRAILVQDGTTEPSELV
jgi:hypothetical protein